MKITDHMRKTAIVLAALSLLLCGCARSSDGVMLYEDETETQEASAPTDSAPQPADGGGQCYVYVCGAVQAPDVYILEQGARVCDAIEAAGGMTEAAAQDYWNLAEAVADGQMIYIPTKEEAAERLQEETDAGAEQDDGLININTADKARLMEIPGIGEAKAEDILAYRKEHGAFSSIEEIQNVPGIKEGLFQKMEEYITIH